jgi:septal ring factor EnvC (AmiA/AmiB activator)
MEQLLARRHEAEAELAKRAEAMQPLLPLLERLSLYPAETLLAIPAGTDDRLRAVLVLQGLGRQLQRESAALRRDQAALDQASQAVKAQMLALEAARNEQAAAAAALDRQFASAEASRVEAERESAAASQRAAEQAARAETLRGVLTTLETQRRAEEARAREEAARAERQKRAAEAEQAREKEAELASPSKGTLASASQPKGQLTAPVAGTIFRAWGDQTDAGPALGISYHAAPAARVVSPCAGRVEFADRFRSYGLLLIVNCGGGYHAVLAGFDRLDVKPGQAVQAGMPVGAMPNWDPGAGNRPALYVELRHGGQPVNPAPFLSARG